MKRQQPKHAASWGDASASIDPSKQSYGTDKKDSARRELQPGSSESEQISLLQAGSNENLPPGDLHAVKGSSQHAVQGKGGAQAWQDRGMTGNAIMPESEGPSPNASQPAFQQGFPPSTTFTQRTQSDAAESSELRGQNAAAASEKGRIESETGDILRDSKGRSIPELGAGRVAALVASAGGGRADKVLGSGEFQIGGC